MLRRRGKRYYLDTYVEGKRYRESLKTTNKYAALDRLNERRRELLAKSQKTDIAFADFTKQYLDWAWATKPSTVANEIVRIRRFQYFLDSQKIVYLSDISTLTIENFRSYLREHSRFRVPRSPAEDRKLAKSTINIYLQLLRTMFYRAIDWGLHKGSNPLKKIKFYKTQESVKGLTAGEIDRILEICRKIAADPQSQLQERFIDMVVLALNTGMRKSEVLNLRWDKLAGDEIMVRGKGSKDRMIPLNEAARDIILKQSRKTEFVFDLPPKNRRNQGIFRRTTEIIRRETGIDFHFHLLRHFMATRLLESGVDIVTISEILGHSKTYTSLIYSHTDSERKHRAVDNLRHNLGHSHNFGDQNKAES
jgi:integrase